MKKSRRFAKTISIAMAAWMTLQPLATVAEDIDIFIGSSAGSRDRPNVLIVLDNTSNWARQNQQWPDGLQQGQAEVRAIKTVINALPADADGNLDYNIGVMEFVTNGTANDAGGFMRSAIKWMSSINKKALSDQMDQIFADINGPTEKRNSNTPYGDLFYDVYNYFAGDEVSLDGSNATRNLNPPSPHVDANGYASVYTKFKTPLSKENSCAQSYVILISNPNASGPATDTAANKAALAALGGDTTTIPLPNLTEVTTSTPASIGTSSACYSSQAACTAALGTVGEFPTCPSGGSAYTNCACTDAVSAVPSCGAGTQRYTVYGRDNQGTTNLGYMSSCVSNVNSCDTSPYASQCTGTGVSCACNASDYVTTGCGANKKKFMIQRNKSNTTETALGYTSACYDNTASCSTSDYTAQCATYPSGCSCGTPTTTSSTCTAGTSRYGVSGTTSETVLKETGTVSTTRGAPWLLDEWARFLYDKGVRVSGGDNQKVATFTVDVYNKQPNADHTALMFSAAKIGGGHYYAATNEKALEFALTDILLKIKAENSTFAAASLPVNATNRAQNENQVFIGMFRPDGAAKPRWFGNLKRYQLMLDTDGVSVILGDKEGNRAINDTIGKGFLDACAVSYWTTDSPKDPTNPSLGYYWKDYPINPSPASECASVIGTAKAYSDLPDGPTVEKGAVAEILRKGNSPTDSTPTWQVNRTFYTTATNTSTTLVNGFSTSSALNTTQQSWAKGHDTENEDGDANADGSANVTETRASIHGDVVHSRPLPVNYDPKIVLYYGSNDGHFRAVDADTGKELWTFMPNEFAQPGFIDRLRTNEPSIKYPGVPSGITPTPKPKDYAWDGSTGIYQNADNSKVWIYPTMRRGGRRVYALDVSTPTSPSIKWIVGCDKDGSNCSSSEFNGIGQTWSTPTPASIAGYSSGPVVFFGGGYDSCEDADTKTPSCGSAKGRKVYVVDADTGTHLFSRDTDRSVPADIALIDMDSDGKVDYAYAVDTGGNIYRIDMVTRTVATDGSITYTARDTGAWTMRKIAQTASGSGRKFLFAPALMPVAKEGRVYVALGSGDREHPLITNYPYSEVINRFYVLVDNLATTTGDPVNLDTLENKTTDQGCTSTAVLPTTTPTGWFMDLNANGQDGAKGEQTVTSTIIVAGLAAFSTNRPLPADEGTCANSLGEARGYWVNLLTGSGAIGVTGNCGGNRSSTFVAGGLPPSPVVGVVPIKGVPRTVVIGAVQREGGASTSISPQKVVPPIAPIRKRLYWKQLGND